MPGFSSALTAADKESKSSGSNFIDVIGGDGWSLVGERSVKRWQEPVNVRMQIWALMAANPVSFAEPAGVAYAAGQLYVADTNNNSIRIVDLPNNSADGVLFTTFPISGLNPPSATSSATAK